MTAGSTERPTCPACDATAVVEIAHWAVGRGRAAMACWACGFLFTHPRTSAEELQQYYGPEGQWQSKHAAAHVAAPTKKKRSAGHLMSALDRYFPATHPRPGARMLDFGCGTGGWLNAFQDQGWVTSGIEPSTDVAFARHERLTSVPDEGIFDFLLVWHVLEHLPRPGDTLRTLAAALAPGGHCLVCVPRVDTVAVHRDLPYVLHHPAHISAYTEACLRGLLASCGLAPVAALHELDPVFSKGVPFRLRLLAQKGGRSEEQPPPEHALRTVIEAVKGLG